MSLVAPLGRVLAACWSLLWHRFVSAALYWRLFGPFIFIEQLRCGFDTVGLGVAGSPLELQRAAVQMRFDVRDLDAFFCNFGEVVGR